jgi:hypothetical protein
MTNVAIYNVPTEVWGEMHLTGLGRVEYEFDRGLFEPDNDEVAAVMAVLLRTGVVELAQQNQPKPEPITAKAAKAKE